MPVLMIVMLSAANFEVLKLLPWTSDKYDGYPMKRAMKLDGIVILMQTLPMIALSLVFRLLYDLDDELAQVVIALKVLQLVATQHLNAFQETARVGKGWQGLQACRGRGVA